MAPSLLIFTTSQSPLAIKSPRPHKPLLNIPALIHRTFHTSFDTSPPSISSDGQTILIPHSDTLIKHDVPPNHTHPPSAVSNPVVTVSQPDAGGHGSAKGDELEAEITVKIHLVSQASPSTRVSWVNDGLETLKAYKGLTEVDTLLIGWKGVDYRGKRTAAADFFGCGAEGLTSDVPSAVGGQMADEVAETWKEISKQHGGGGQGVKELGTLYLPLELLQRLNSVSRVGVNSLDTPDCHSLPKGYTQYAKENGIELWAGGGGEGSDPLPDADLHNLLNEFIGVIPESLSDLKDSEALERLGTLIPLRVDGLKYDESAKRGVEVKWILGYTLVSKSRNVLKDKGYIIAADFTT